MNYCLAEEKSDLVLFPFGLTGLANHHNENDNVEIQWFQGWNIKSNGSSFEDPLQWSIESLIQLSFAKLDIVFIAKRDIDKDEEIYVKYGDEWQTQYDLYNELLLINENNLNTCNKMFRQYMKPPIGLYQSHWFN